jgi:nucleotide-binding universal stress UspA family protein
MVLMGLDDSAAARAALSWAVRYCRATRTVLRAVNVLDRRLNVATSGRPEQALFLPEREVPWEHRHVIHGIFRDAKPEPWWMLTFAEGDAGDVLVRLAEECDAELLVVGTQEHVGLRRAILGSVSNYCLSHAPCPVVAVPRTT